MIPLLPAFYRRPPPLGSLVAPLLVFARSAARRGAWVIALGGLGACATAPQHTPPQVPELTAYGAPSLTETTLATPQLPAGAAQTFLQGKPVPQQWWRLFGSEKLNGLVEQALAASPTVAAAQAALRGAEQQALAARAGLLPRIDANASGTRQKIDTGSFGNPEGGSFVYNLFNANLQVSYNLDWFGRSARAVDASLAAVAQQQYQAQASYQTLIANVVTTAVQQALESALIDGQLQVIDAQERLLSLAQKQYALGALSRVEVLALDASVAAERSKLPALRAALGREQTRLALYLGQADSRAGVLDVQLTDLTLPQQLPVSLPSELVRQRADVLAAEAELQRAEALLGVAHANRFPSLNLTASFGSQSSQLDELFKGDIWSLGAGLTAPIFRAGELQALEKVAEAEAARARANYQQTLLQAFGSVADALRQLGSDAETLHAQVAAVNAADAVRQLTEQQLRLGAASSRQRILADQQYTQARAGAAQAVAARFQNTVALLQALGGGWNVPAQPADRSPSAQP